jgi:uncharacterized RDD family membrane protein YckC
MNEILDAPVSIDKQFKYAGFWIRVGSYFIDAIILGIVQMVLAFSFFGGYSFMQPNYSLVGISTIIGVLYYSIMESSTKQATIGKMAVGIKVGKAGGEQISFLNALGRYFAKILSGLILGIGFMMVGWDDRKQGLHDKLAKTYVYAAE